MDNHDDFALGLGDDGGDLHEDLAPPRYAPAGFINISGGLIAAVLGGIGLVSMLAGLGGGFQLRATGPGVAELEEGARVVLGQKAVGEVDEIELVGSQMVAVLSLDSELEGRLREGMRFKIGSTNRWLPGNVGIHIDPSGAHGPALRDGGEIPLDSALLPDVPGRFLALLGIAALVLLGTCGLFWLVKQVVVLLLGLGVLLFVLGWLGSHVTPLSSFLGS